MNLPTKLTFLRIFLIPVFVAVYFIAFPYHRFVAVGIFALACFTDFLDGYLARKNNQVTTLGKFLDPIADKLLVACALIAIAMEQHDLQVVVGICTMIILCRELMVSCFRIMAASKNVVLAADIWGKLKTTFQMIAMILLLPYKSITELGLSDTFCSVYYYIGFGLLCLATLFTIISGTNYIVKNKGVLKEE